MSLIERLPKRAELVLVNVLCFGPFIWLSVAGLLRHERVLLYDDRRLYTYLAIEVVCGTLAIALLRARGWKLADFGLRFSMPQTIGGMMLFIATNLLIAGFYAALRDVTGTDPAAATTPLIRTTWLPVILMLAIDPLYEEGLIVAYNLRATAQDGAAFAITLSATIRLLCYLYQGPVAAFTVLPMALIFAAVYWKTRRLWPLMVAHAAATYFSLAPGTTFQS